MTRLNRYYHKIGTPQSVSRSAKPRVVRPVLLETLLPLSLLSFLLTSQPVSYTYDTSIHTRVNNNSNNNNRSLFQGTGTKEREKKKAREAGEQDGGQGGTQRNKHRGLRWILLLLRLSTMDYSTKG